MEIKVDMKQFKANWKWTDETVHYGNKIAQTKGNMFTFDGEVYKRLLTDFNIFFTATPA